MKKKGRIGSSFDDFLKEDGLHEEVTARATLRVQGRRRAITRKGLASAPPPASKMQAHRRQK